jgi:methylenetetrahydrofolate reductase (NADPH)
MKIVDGGTAHSAVRLARESSIEVSCIEAADIRAGRDFLPAGQKVYVSHLPRQTWAQTRDTCAQVAAAGFDPVPHVPVRLVGSEPELDEIFRALRNAGAGELLLISGDYSRPLGPYAQVLDVMRSGKLQAYGFTRVSVAGHPEGHPGVPPEEIRSAQIEKSAMGATAGLQVTLVTQFFFEAAPFIDWARGLRRAGVSARIVAGLAGPASIRKLLGLAKHCGVGPSMRALTSRSGAMLKLFSDRTPDLLLDELSREKHHEPAVLDGIHLYSFGGFLRTAAWLRQAVDSSRGCALLDRNEVRGFGH